MEYSMVDERTRQGQPSSAVKFVVTGRRFGRSQRHCSTQRPLWPEERPSVPPPAVETNSDTRTSVHTCDRGPPPVPGWIDGTAVLVGLLCGVSSYSRSRAVSVEPLGTTQWVEVLLLLDARQTKLRLFILSMTELHATARVIIKKVDSIMMADILVCVLYKVMHVTHTHFCVFSSLPCLVLSWIQTLQ